MIFLSPFREEPGDTYRSCLTADFTVDLEKGYQGNHDFVSLENGFRFASLHDDFFTLYTGYASDLCSPAVRIGRKWLGTPSSEKEKPGAYIHDAARQVMRLACCPWNRKDTDDFFWDALTVTGSRQRNTYHFAVSSVIGSVFMLLTRKEPDCFCELCTQKRE